MCEKSKRTSEFNKPKNGKIKNEHEVLSIFTESLFNFASFKLSANIVSTFSTRIKNYDICKKIETNELKIVMQVFNISFKFQTGKCQSMTLINANVVEMTSSWKNCRIGIDSKILIKASQLCKKSV